MVDECATGLAVPSLSQQDYTLYDSTATSFNLELDVVGSSSLRNTCAYTIKVTSAVPATLQLPSDFDDDSTFNASRPRDAVVASALYTTGAYSTSLVGLKTVSFEYNWSKDSVQTLDVNLNIVDSCGSALTIPAGAFTLTVPSMNS